MIGAEDLPSHVEPELASQPACWRRAVELADHVRGRFPAPGERVAVVGCGTSRHMAQAWALRREALGRGETDAFAASQFPRGRSYDGIVGLTRSGATTEVLAVRPTLAVTAVGDAPVVDVAADTIVLDFAAERSVVQTRFATTALALLRAVVDDPLLPAAVDDVERALTLPLPAEPGAHRHLVFLGSGWTEGLAQEAALKCQESAGVWAEAYAAMEYRHGPISACGPHSLVWALGSLPPGLPDQIAAMGATVVGGDLEPMAELVRAQRFAVALARRAGLDPDHPRGLSFSVVLPP